MTQDEIIRMAQGYEPTFTWQQLQAAVLAEREACAKVCRNKLLPNPTTDLFDAGFNRGIGKCAAAIRARGETK